MKKNSVRVLAYHGINDIENFEKQIKFLKANYDIISFEDLASGKLCSTRPILITFDDIERSVYTKAFPILLKYKIPAIVFIVTELLNTNRPFWWNEVVYYLGPLDGAKKNKELKEFSNQDRLKYLDELRSTFKNKILEYEQLKTSELEEMSAGDIVVANHSHTHPMFDQCIEDELKKEMLLSNNILNSLGFCAHVFAYPNGNYSPKAEKVLVENGVEYAFLFDHKINKSILNPLRISRLSVNDTTPLWKYKIILSGLHSKVLPFTKLVSHSILKLKKRAN